MVGEYSVALPDGRIQHVRYHANRLTGTTMEVTYEGEAHHPDLTLPLISSPPPTPIPRLARSNDKKHSRRARNYADLENENEPGISELLMEDDSLSYEDLLEQIDEALSELENEEALIPSQIRKPRSSVSLHNPNPTRRPIIRRRKPSATSFANLKIKPFVHHESLRPRRRIDIPVRSKRKPSHSYRRYRDYRGTLYRHQLL